MAIKTFRPYTPGRRFYQVEDFSNLTKKPREKSLTIGKRKSGGRNNFGQITVRHIGGGARQAYSIVDFKRKDRWGIPGKIAAIEYDPNRSARICLVDYADGAKRYILHAEGVKVGDAVMSGPESPIRTGNALPLWAIPEGTFVHAIELMPGKGAAMARSAGAQVQLMAKNKEKVTLKMPSGEVRLVDKDCMATIGQVGNIEHNTVSRGYAGANRHRGIRPTVRGSAMNACDHPLGGGRGKSKGMNHPQSPWGQKSKGLKTRHKKQWTHMILRDRRQSSVAVTEAAST